MRKILAILASAAFLAGCTQTEICVATYNVGAFRKYQDNTVPMVAAMMNEIGAVAVGVNEIDSVTTRTSQRDELKEFAEAMGEGWDYNFSRAMPYAGGAYGIGTVVSPKFKVTGKYSVSLPKCDGSEPRALSVIETESFVFASTHLDHISDSARMVQAQTITSWMEERYADSRKPVILSGDFNDSPDSDVLSYLSENWNIISEQAPTFPSRGPRACIDFIMLLRNKAASKVLDTKVCTEFESGDVEEASDHLPLYAKLKIRR